MIRTLFLAAAFAFPAATGASAHDSSKSADVTLVYEHELPNVPGKSIKGVLVEYGPGGFSEGHTHPDTAFIYATVLEGSIRSQVNDGPVKVYQAGESFSEMPATVMASAPTAARLSPPACSPSSSSTPTRKS